jgi:hypothetical protein
MGPWRRESLFETAIGSPKGMRVKGMRFSKVCPPWHEQVSNRAASASSNEELHAVPDADGEKSDPLVNRTSSSPEFWGLTRRLLPRMEALKSDDLEDLAAMRRSLSRQRGFRRSSAYNVDPERDHDESAESPVIIRPLKARSSSPAVLRGTRLLHTASSRRLSGLASGYDPPHVACTRSIDV